MKNTKANPIEVFNKSLKRQRVAFRDLPETHQKAMFQYMALDGAAWDDELTIKKAIKKYGHMEFEIGMVKTDDVLKAAIMAGDEIGEDEDIKTFDDYVEWYDCNCQIGDFREEYNELWPVILDENIERAMDSGVFQDGWHRFNRYMQDNLPEFPFIAYCDDVDYWSLDEDKY